MHYSQVMNLSLLNSQSSLPHMCRLNSRHSALCLETKKLIRSNKTKIYRVLSVAAGKWEETCCNKTSLPCSSTWSVVNLFYLSLTLHAILMRKVTFCSVLTICVCPEIRLSLLTLTFKSLLRCTYSFEIQIQFMHLSSQKSEQR